MAGTETFPAFVVAAPAATSIADTDDLVIIATPGSTPTTKKITRANEQATFRVEHSSAGAHINYPAAGVPLSLGATAGWSTSYTVGVAANNLVKLNASAQLPAVDGSLLTNISWGSINTKTAAYDIVAADMGKVFCFNNTSADIIVTLPAAASVNSGAGVDVYATGTKVVTLDVGSGNYWWGLTSSPNIGRYVILASKAKIWSNGTYWYCSPCYVHIDPSVRVLTNGNHATTFTAVSLAACVPASAKFIWGTLILSGTNANLYVTAKSSATTADFYLTGVGSSVTVSTAYSLYLQTPQNIYYVVDGSSPLGSIDVNGYGF